jgi:lysophospholipase L1-like esterase
MASLAVRLVRSCPRKQRKRRGESVVTMVSGGQCTYKRGSQLAQAVDFLERHGRFTRVITLNIGSNDVQTCVDRTTLVIDLVCVQAGFNSIAAELPTAIATLRALAPNATIVVLNYYNPFLAAYLAGPAGQAVAQQSAGLQARLNEIIAAAAASNGARLADVAAAFQSTNWTPAVFPGVGAVPINVGLICIRTWMCTRGDIHPNDTGYQVIAATVVGRL